MGGMAGDWKVKQRFKISQLLENYGDRCWYLDKLEAGVDEGRFQQRLDAGDPHPIGRRRGERDGRLGGRERCG